MENPKTSVTEDIIPDNFEQFDKDTLNSTDYYHYMKLDHEQDKLDFKWKHCDFEPLNLASSQAWRIIST